MLVSITVLICIFGTASLALKVVEIKQLNWITKTWTAYLNNIANHVNPKHDTLPGDM